VVSRCPVARGLAPQLRGKPRLSHPGDLAQIQCSIFLHFQLPAHKAEFPEFLGNINDIRVVPLGSAELGVNRAYSFGMFWRVLTDEFCSTHRDNILISLKKYKRTP